MAGEISDSDVDQVAQAIAENVWMPRRLIIWAEMTAHMKGYARREARAALEKASELGWRKVA